MEYAAIQLFIQADNVQLGIMGGRDCASNRILTVAPPIPVVDCKDNYAARLVVDGKEIGRIPLDGLKPEQIDGLRKAASGLRQ